MIKSYEIIRSRVIFTRLFAQLLNLGLACKQAALNFCQRIRITRTILTTHFCGNECILRNLCHLESYVASWMSPFATVCDAFLGPSSSGCLTLLGLEWNFCKRPSRYHLLFSNWPKSPFEEVICIYPCGHIQAFRLLLWHIGKVEEQVIGNSAWPFETLMWNCQMYCVF